MRPNTLSSCFAVYNNSIFQEFQLENLLGNIFIINMSKIQSSVLSISPELINCPCTCTGMSITEIAEQAIIHILLQNIETKSSMQLARQNVW